jgi:hypothetical protein
MLATLASFGCALAALRRRERGERVSPLWVAGFWFAGIAACYLHYFGLLFFALVALALGLRALWQPRVLPQAALLTLPVAIAFLPWLGFAYQDAAGPPNWIPPTPLEAPLDYLEFLFKRPGDMSQVVMLLLLAFALVSWRRRGGHAGRVELPATALVCAWLLLPFAAAVAISFALTPVFTARNLIISLPAAYLLLARAALQVPRSPRLAVGLAIGLVGMSAYGVLGNARYWRRPHKEQFREAAAALAAWPQSAEGERILAYPGFGFDYYLARQVLPRRVDFALAPRPRLEAAAPYLARERPATLWLLTAHFDAAPELLRALELDYRLVLEERFYYAWLRRYERR